MRILGSRPHDADQTTTVNMLSSVGLLKPEIMMNVANLYEDSLSTFSSFMARKGLMQGGLYAGMDNNEFKVVGSRKVMWPMEGYPVRKGVIVTAPVGNTPGLNHAEFTIIVNTDFFSQNDTLELVDRRTLLFVLSKTRQAEGQYAYRVKLVTNNAASFCDPTLVAAGLEVGVSSNMFPELSEDGGEKHTYPEWHTEYMSIQRMKHTISGSAKATKIWLEHNGTLLWDYSQNLDMMRRWAYVRENALLFGIATVSPNDDVVHLRDDDGKEIVSGNGLFAQGDPSLKFQYNNLSIRLIEKIMENLELLKTGDGQLEVAVCGGQVFFNNFQRLMRDVLQQNPLPLYERGVDGDGIRTNFGWYQFGGVRLHVMRCPAFDAPFRPILRDAYGNSNMSERAFFVNLGNTIGGNPNVQLLTIGNGEEDRRFVQRSINGMTGQGPMVSAGSKQGNIQLASSPVDGQQIHVLAESGVMMRNMYGFAELNKALRR